MMKRLLFAVFAASLVLTSCSDGGGGATTKGVPEAGGGVLEQVVGPTGSTAGFGDFSAGSDKSFGIFVCARDGDVTLESIEALNVEGDIEMLGAMVYRSSDSFIGATDGYPPTGVDASRLTPIDGAVIDVDCAKPEGSERVQLVVGAERTSSGGGSISGLLIHTSSGPVQVDFTILLCGDQLQHCDVLEHQGG